MDQVIPGTDDQTNRKYQLRPSRVLRRWRESKVAISLKMNTRDPRTAEMFAASGVDNLWVCTEHVPNDWPTLEQLIRAAKLHDVDTMVRIAKGPYSNFITGLEADASGIMVPHIMSLNEAKEVVSMTRFPPLGRRAADGGNADAQYCRVPLAEYIKQANRERFLALQIEDPEVLADLETIAALEGVDMLFFGAGDYSVTIGKPGQIDDPEIQQLYERIAKVARENGIHAGAACRMDCAQRYIDMGYDFLNCGGDVAALTGFSNEVATLTNQAAK